MGIHVDKKDNLNLHQSHKKIYPQINIPNNNRLLNKKGINIKYYGRY